MARQVPRGAVLAATAAALPWIRALSLAGPLPPAVRCRAMPRKPGAARAAAVTAAAATTTTDADGPRRGKRARGDGGCTGPSETAKGARRVAATSRGAVPPGPVAPTVPSPPTAAPSPWYTAFTRGDAQYDRYMATEWGFETRGDAALFELLCLEGAQAGLSWRTILRKRAHYRAAFHGFDVDRVAAMTEAAVELLLVAEGESTVVRHRGKVEAVVHNARCVQAMRAAAEHDAGTVLDRLLWSFVEDRPILNGHIWNGSLQGLPTTSPESVAMSRALKRLGFRFVGPTTCYSLMQSAGMVIDHPLDTPEWQSARARLEQREGGFQDRTTRRKENA